MIASVGLARHAGEDRDQSAGRATRDDQDGASGDAAGERLQDDRERVFGRRMTLQLLDALALREGHRRDLEA